MGGIHRERQTHSHNMCENPFPFGMKFCIAAPWMSDIDLRGQKGKNGKVTVKFKIENESASN